MAVARQFRLADDFGCPTISLPPTRSECYDSFKRSNLRRALHPCSMDPAQFTQSSSSSRFMFVGGPKIKNMNSSTDRRSIRSRMMRRVCGEKAEHSRRESLRQLEGLLHESGSAARCNCRHALPGKLQGSDQLAKPTMSSGACNLTQLARIHPRTSPGSQGICLFCRSVLGNNSRCEMNVSNEHTRATFSLLGSGRSDPFSVYAEAQNRRFHELIDHC